MIDCHCGFIFAEGSALIIRSIISINPISTERDSSLGRNCQGGQKTKSPQPKLQRGLPEEQPCGFLIGPQAGQDIGLPEFCGGRGGIRTHGPASGTPDFESGAFDQLSHPSTGEKTEVGKISQMAGLSMI
jgi:hypothetical protein